MTFKVAKAFRSRFETCITVTRTPFDDDWFDAYVLLSLLEGHPVTTPDRMLSLFSETKLLKDGVRRRVDPKGRKKARFRKLMGAVMLKQGMAALNAR